MKYLDIMKSDRAAIDLRLQKVEKMLRNPLNRGKRLQTLREEWNALESRLGQLDRQETERQGLTDGTRA